MNVTVVIPAYNEAPVIRSVVEGVRALGYDVLVVNDGSSDDTTGEAYMGGAEVFRSVGNYGAGASIGFGIEWAKCYHHPDVIVTCDADGQHDPADIPKLVAALDGCDMVNGSRFLGSHTGMPWHRRLALWVVYVVFWLVSGREITDPCCGMKAFRPEVFKIRSHRMAWAAELCWRVSRKGLIREVPIHVKYTEYSMRKGQRTSNIFRAGLELARAIKGE